MYKRKLLYNFIGIALLIHPWQVNCQVMKILTLGNSLTKGVYCTNGSVSPVCNQLDDPYMIGYRYYLFNLLTDAGYEVVFAGNELAGTAIFSDYTQARHAGYPGITTTGLASKLNENSSYLLSSTQPDIILLEIGTNDVYGGATSITGVTSILDEIDEYETTSGKPILVFLSKIIKFTEGTTNEAKVTTFNSNLSTLYTTRKAAGDLIELTDIGATLINTMVADGGDMSDQLHPVQAGYDKMALIWYNVLNSYNAAPVTSQIPGQSAAEGNSFSVISLDNYITDTETPDASIQWSLVQTPQYFDVSISSDRKLTITPVDENWNGTESISLKATDTGKNGFTGFRKSVSITFSCTVTAVNDPPVITGQARIPNTLEETPLSIALTDLLYEDVDNLPEELSLQVLSGSNYTFNGNTITPVTDFNGELTVNLRINDPAASSEAFAFKIMVSAKNDIPVINAATSRSFDEDSYCIIRLNDLQVTDPDNFYPADFTLVIENGLYYTHLGDTIFPAKDFNGELAVNIRVRDLLDQSESFVYTLTVNPVNDPPGIIIPDNRSTLAGQYFEMQLTADDPDINDALELQVVVSPSWLTFDPVYTKLSGTSQNPHAGINMVKVTVSDSYVSVDSVFTIDVMFNTGLTNDMNSSNAYEVLPNPAQAEFRITSNLGDGFPVIFTLYNISGFKILERTLIEDTVFYPAEYKLVSGIYLYQITGPVDTFTGKLIINSP